MINKDKGKANLSIGFAGTPQFAAGHLEELIQKGFNIKWVLTQPDRPAGRGKKLQKSAVKITSEENHIPTIQFEKINQEAKGVITNSGNIDILIVIAYGLLLPKWLLNYPKFGAINVHASLLPRWRGAAPIQRAIESADEESGIGVMQMEEGLDTGPIWLEKKCKISKNMNTLMLHDKLLSLGKEAIIEVIPKIISGKNKPTPQSLSGITYAKKILKHEAKIRWEEPADLIVRKINAFNPFPIAFSVIYDDKEEIKLKIHNAIYNHSNNNKSNPGEVIKEDNQGIHVITKEGTVIITKLQLTGKKAVSAKEFLNSKSLLGKRFK